MHKPLNDIIEEYEALRENFKSYSKQGDNNKSTLLEYQERFVHIKADLRYWHSTVMFKAENRSDKAATAIKYRIAVSISEGEFVDENGNLIYDKCSITQAEKYAASSKKYKDFLDQRAFYRESLVNINDMREDINSYINLIKDKIKNEQ